MVPRVQLVTGVSVLFPTVASIVVRLLIVAAGVIALCRTARHDPQFLHFLYRCLKNGSVTGAVPLETKDSNWQV